jgi:hypothetical protein
VAVPSKRGDSLRVVWKNLCQDLRYAKPLAREDKDIGDTRDDVCSMGMVILTGHVPPLMIFSNERASGIP